MKSQRKPIKTIEVDISMWKADLMRENDEAYLTEGKCMGELVAMLEGKMPNRTMQKRVTELLENGDWIKGWKYIIDTRGHKQRKPCYMPAKDKSG